MFFPGGGDILARAHDRHRVRHLHRRPLRAGRGIGYFEDTVELPVNWSVLGIWLYPSTVDCLLP